MKLRLGKLALLWGDRCALEECGYYAHYLRSGPPTISHAAYHRAEQECLAWQQAAEYYMDHNQHIPPGIERMCLKLEEEIRA